MGIIDKTSTVVYEVSGQAFKHTGKVLGKGWYATVYEAIDTVSKKLRADKVFPSPSRAKEGHVPKPEEIEMEKKILKIFDRFKGEVKDTKGDTHIFQSLIPGKPIYESMDFLNREKFSHLIKYCISSVEQLRVMHADGIIHTDLHPGNFLINKEKTKLKLIDFGGAKKLKDGKVEIDATGLPDIFPGKMRQQKTMTLSKSTDQFALAMTLSYMLSKSGHFPKRDDNGNVASSLVNYDKLQGIATKDECAKLEKILQKLASQDTASLTEITEQLTELLTNVQQREKETLAPNMVRAADTGQVFEILKDKKLGEGWSAITYKARNVQTGEIVAAKEFKPGRASDEEQYKHEQAILSNYGRYRGHGIANGHVYTFQSLVNGNDLTHSLKNLSSVPFANLIDSCTSAVQELETMHKANYIHADINANNIMLGSDQKSMKLIDFNRSTYMGDAEHISLKKGGEMKTFPSHAINGDTMRLSKATDRYALGMTLGYMFSKDGSYPASSQSRFVDETKFARISKNQRTELDEIIKMLMDPKVEYLSEVTARLKALRSKVG